MTRNIDRLITVLRKSNGKNILPKGLDVKLAERAGLTLVDVRRCLLELKEKGWVRSAEWDARGIPLAKLEVCLPPEPLKPYEEKWINALNDSLLTDPEITALLPVAKAIPEMSAGEMSSVIKGLVELRDEQHRLTSKRKYQVSARYLLSSSKLIKNLPSRCLVEFGIQLDLLEGPPRYAVVAGSEKPHATILVENPHSFEDAILADTENRFCWVSTYGYGLSKQGESFGEQLTEIIIAKKEVITLSRRKIFVDLKNAVEETPGRLYFWGDLDLAGLDIYGRLKSVLPKMTLCPLYQPMIETLREGRGHSYKGVQKEGQKLGSYPYAEIASLANLCQTHGVDQESITVTPELLGRLMI